MNQEQNQVKKTKSNVRKIRIKPGQVIQIVHPDTGTVINFAIDLRPDSRTFECMCVTYESNPDGLGFCWNEYLSHKFIDPLIASSDEVQS